MRDPARIERILAKVRAYWYRYPDTRLGQMIENFTTPGHDPYFLEDEELEQKLDQSISRL